MRKIPLVNGHIYHIFNRGVNKSKIYFSDEDYARFISALLHYKFKNTRFSYEKEVNLNDPVSLVENRKPKVKIIAYCLMSNHFHLLIKQIADNGITSYMRHLANSYSHYVNVKYKRTGHLFQGRFKNVLIETDEQLIHTSRYIHLNPLVSNLTFQLKEYKWSSYHNYIFKDKLSICDPDLVLSHFKSSDDYEKFVLDQADYGRELTKIKHLTIDNE